MGWDMEPGIGGIRSAMGGTGAIEVSEVFTDRPVPLGQGPCHRPMRRRNSGKNTDHPGLASAMAVRAAGSSESGRTALSVPGKAFDLFDRFFEAVIGFPAHAGLSGVPTPRSHP